MSLQRPIGISILAILYGIGGVFLIIFSLAMGAASNVSEFLLPYEFWMEPELIAVVAAFLLILGVLFVVAANGLWKGKGWARNFALALQVVGILVDLGFTSFAGGSALFGIIFNLIIIYYLTRPGVKAFFSQAPTPLTGVPPSPTTPTYAPSPPPPADTLRGQRTVGGVQPGVFCAQCGAENASGAVFCKTCGTRLVT